MWHQVILPQAARAGLIASAGFNEPRVRRFDRWRKTFIAPRSSGFAATMTCAAPAIAA